VLDHPLRSVFAQREQRAGPTALVPRRDQRVADRLRSQAARSASRYLERCADQRSRAIEFRTRRLGEYGSRAIVVKLEEFGSRYTHLSAVVAL
jgi:hypothetical protein